MPRRRGATTATDGADLGEMPRRRPGPPYMDDTKMRAAFDRRVAAGEPVFPGELAREAGVSRDTMRRWLRRTGRWTEELRRQMYQAHWARVNARLDVVGRKQIARQAAEGYPNLAKGRAVLVARAAERRREREAAEAAAPAKVVVLSDDEWEALDDLDGADGYEPGGDLDALLRGGAA